MFIKNQINNLIMLHFMKYSVYFLYKTKIKFLILLLNFIFSIRLDFNLFYTDILIKRGREKTIQEDISG